MNENRGSIRRPIFLLSLALIFILSIYPCWPQEQSANPQSEAPGQAGIIVDLDLKEADIKDVARALSRISGKNIIVSEEVKSKITLRVKDMHWRDALNMILETNGLTMLEKENYIIITTYEKRRATEESGDLQTRIVRFNFVDVLGIQKTLTSMLTRRGKMETDVRTNSLVITDIPDVINTVERVALQLDTKTPQVLIEAMILTVKLNDDEKLGVNWEIVHKTRPERSLKQDLDLGGLGSSSFWQLKYGKTLYSAANLAATIDLLVEQKRADILANPRVLTLDNLPATIDLTEQVPYTQQSTSTESSSSVTSTQFKDVPIRLVVKPHITKDNYILMNIQTEQSVRTGFTSDNQPIIDSRRAETNVMVRDAETIVIGGLRKKEDTVTVDKLPLLGDIPFLGALFRKTIRSKVDTELVIFVTPYVATDLKMAEKEKEQLEHSNDLAGNNERKPLQKIVEPAKDKSRDETMQDSLKKSEDKEPAPKQKLQESTRPREEKRKKQAVKPAKKADKKIEKQQPEDKSRDKAMQDSLLQKAAQPLKEGRKKKAVKPAKAAANKIVKAPPEDKTENKPREASGERPLVWDVGADTLCSLGEVFLAQGRLTEARHEFEKCLLINPEHKKAKELLQKTIQPVKGI